MGLSSTTNMVPSLLGAVGVKVSLMPDIVSVVLSAAKVKDLLDYLGLIADFIEK